MLVDEIKRFVEGIPAALKEKRGVYSVEFTVAERKAFLSKKKLTYSAKFRVDDDSKELRFTEALKESGSGVSAGDAGFGFKKETYKTGTGREGRFHRRAVHVVRRTVQLHVRLLESEDFHGKRGPQGRLRVQVPDYLSRPVGTLVSAHHPRADRLIRGTASAALPRSFRRSSRRSNAVQKDSR